MIEIITPATADRDRDLKRELYQRHGIAEYWIVDPDAETVEVWRFAAGATEAEIHTGRRPLRLRGQTIGEIVLSDVFPPER